MTTRETLIQDADRRNDPAAAEHLRQMTDEQVDAVLECFGKWARELEEVAQQMYASAVKAFAPLAALAEKYRDAS